jgi:CheY-like chemotaxis protein
MVEEDSEPAPAPQIVRGVETVLLVDDEEMVLDVGRAMLERLGYRLITARSGREAIAAFERCAGRIDLAILDMVLPDMSGGEIFNQLRARNGALKVLLASGYSIDEQAREVLTRGGNGFIQKPFSLEQLSRKLREVLGMQPGALSEGPDAAAPLGPAADPAA